MLKDEIVRRAKQFVRRALRQSSQPSSLYILSSEAIRTWSAEAKLNLVLFHKEVKEAIRMRSGEAKPTACVLDEVYGILKDRKGYRI